MLKITLQHLAGVLTELLEIQYKRGSEWEPTRVTECVYGKGGKIGVISAILFEHIDTDCWEEADGCMGNQYRYSLWMVESAWDAPVKRLYVDHAYIRPFTPHASSGSRGRHCTLSGLRIKSGVIKVRHCKGTAEKPEWEQLAFNIKDVE